MKPEELLKEANLLQETIVSNRRYLHSHAETGFDLKNTLAFVKKELIDMGYEPIECGKAGAPIPGTGTITVPALKGIPAIT